MHNITIEVHNYICILGVRDILEYIVPLRLSGRDFLVLDQKLDPEFSEPLAGFNPIKVKKKVQKPRLVNSCFNPRTGQNPLHMHPALG